MNKWIGISLGTLVGISHIGMLGLLMSKDSKLPVIDIPKGNYVSLDAEVGEDGYKISYKANNPKTCLLYTSPSPRDLSTSRMPSSA